ncbi:MAG: cation-translocating P-type ATPase C-terminal domain-containing protein [Bacillota bacterium]
MNLPHPLLPAQILLVNLVTDGLPAVALGLEPSDAGLMRRPPRDVSESVLSGRLGARIAGRGLLIGLVSTAVFAAFFTAGADLAAARTGALVTIVISQLIHACQTHYMGGTTGSIMGTNPGLAGAVLSSFVVMLTVMYVPPLAAVMGLVALDVTAFAICAAAALAGPVLERILTGISRGRLVVEA